MSENKIRVRCLENLLYEWQTGKILFPYFESVLLAILRNFSRVFINSFCQPENAPWFNATRDLMRPLRQFILWSVFDRIDDCSSRVMVACILKHIPQAGTTKEPAASKKSNLIFAALGSGMYFHSPTFS